MLTRLGLSGDRSPSHKIIILGASRCRIDSTALLNGRTARGSQQMVAPTLTYHKRYLFGSSNFFRVVVSHLFSLDAFVLITRGSVYSTQSLQ